MSELGKIIKKKRREKGLSLKKVCDEVINDVTNKPISVSYLNDIEQGHRLKPSGSILVKIAMVLDLNKDELLQLADKADPELEEGIRDPQLAALFRKIKADPKAAEKFLEQKDKL